MDKRTIIGFVLIALVLFGFSYYQGQQAKKAALLKHIADSTAVANGQMPAAEVPAEQPSDAVSGATPASHGEAAGKDVIYKDAGLNRARHGEAETVKLENDRFVVEFTTQGAQPYSVMMKNFYNYDSTALYIFKPGKSTYNLSVYAGEYISTKDFNFTIASCTDSTVVMRLPFDGGGYIEQKYAIHEGSCSVDNLVSFIGMGNVIPKNVSSCDIDVDMTIPRMEKGYKYECQYSKMDWYFDGDKKPEEKGGGRNHTKRIDSKLSWFAFQQQFFCAIVRAPQQFSSGELNISFFGPEDQERNLMQCTAKMRADFAPSDNVTIPIEFYFGPNHYRTLAEYGHNYEKIIPLGGWLVGWFTKWAIIPMFNILHRHIASFGLIILLMTLVIKIVVLPLTYKSYAASAKMQALKPEIDKLNEKYPKQTQEEQLKKQQATMALYKRAGVNPMGGCLPMLLTFPILWAMFRFFPASIELRQQSFLWCHDLSSYDSILDFGVNVPLLGDHLSLFALLMSVTMWAYTKFAMPSQTGSDPNAKMMRVMSIWMMPIMMFFICNSLSAALSYYYLLSQLIATAETLVIRKFFIHPEELLEKVRASEGKPLPKSKWMQRLEEAQRMQQKQLQEQQKKKRR